MEYEENYDDFLKHYGVLGMKWGKRKARSTVSSNKKPKSAAITKPKQTPKPKSKPTQRRLSDAELRAVVNRMRLEREYADLTYRASSRSKVESVVRTIGTVAALTTSAVKIYNNLNTICKVVKAVT